jgi:protein-disulfide isomerase
MKRLAVLVVIFVITLFCTQPGFSQSSEELKALKDEIKALKEGQTSIQKDLQEIKTLLRTKQAQPQAQPQPEFKETVVSIDNDPFKGDKNARLVLIEFSDYQ